MNAVVDSDMTPMPFANFGKTHIKIPAGTCLGILKEYPRVDAAEAAVMINLTDIFKGLPAVFEESQAADFAAVDANPFVQVVQADIEQTEVDEADISDHWGLDVQANVVI